MYEHLKTTWVRNKIPLILKNLLETSLSKNTTYHGGGMENRKVSNEYEYIHENNKIEA